MDGELLEDRKIKVKKAQQQRQPSTSLPEEGGKGRNHNRSREGDYWKGRSVSQTMENRSAWLAEDQRLGADRSWRLAHNPVHDGTPME